jgi:hypothetical protein
MVCMAKRDQNDELSAELRNTFSAAEGVDHVYGANEFASIGFRLASASDQAPNLVLIAKPDYAFTSKEGKSFVTEPNAATHGYLNDDPKMQAVFIAHGAHVPKRSQAQCDFQSGCCPTIAEMLGLEMKQGRGLCVGGMCD